MLSKNKKIRWMIFGVLVCFNILAWIAIYDLAQPQFLKAIFFDVREGDAIFVESPQKHQILIDGGPDSQILEKLAKELPFYDRSLDLIILSHPERDHLSGLLEVLKRYKIENILWTGIFRETPEWEEWDRLIKKEGAEIKIAEVGQKVILQNSYPKITLDIFHPFENLDGKDFKNSNDTSIVARLTFGDISFLFTGDISKSIEEKMIERDINLESEVLKVSHHGSKTSTSQEFLKKVLPKIAIIQVGKNNYGHPHPEVLASLEQFGIQILRTDKRGDIKIVSDRDNYKIITKKL